MHQFRSVATAILATAIAFSASAAMAGPWVKGESPHAVIYSNNGEKKVREYARYLEVFNLAADKLLNEIGNRAAGSVHKQSFYYMENLREFKIVRPDIEEKVFIPEISCPDYGHSYFSVMQQFNYQSRDPRYIDADLAYLLRSYAGVKIAQYFDTQLPAWLKNGMQDYFMTMNIDKGDVIVGLPLPDMMMDKDSQIVESSTFLPIDTVIAGKGTRQIGRVEQWVVVTYLLSSPEGRARLSDYLNRLARGEDTVTAFHAATGIDDKKLHDLFIAYAYKHVPFLTYHFDLKLDSNVATTRLPDYHTDVPLMLAALRTCPPRPQGEQLLSELRTLGAAFPQDGVVNEALTLAEIDFGNPEQARPLLERRLAANPQDVEALLQKARMLLALGDAASGDKRNGLYSEARSLLARAQALDPGNPSISYTLDRAGP